MEFARLSKHHITFSGKAGTPLTDQVDITPIHPFKITEVQAKPGRYVRVTWTEVKQDKQPFFRLTIECPAESSGRFIESIVIFTDSPIRPKLIIPVQGFAR